MQRAVPACARHCNAYRELILLLRFLLCSNDLGPAMVVITVAAMARNVSSNDWLRSMRLSVKANEHHAAFTPSSLWTRPDTFTKLQV